MYQKTLTSAMMLRRYRMGVPGFVRLELCLILSRDPGDAQKVLKVMTMKGRIASNNRNGLIIIFL